MDIVPQLVFNALITGSMYSFVATGLVLTTGVMRVLNFAHGHVMMLGAYTFYAAQEIFFLPFALCALAALVVSGAAGLLTLHCFVQPFARYNIVLSLVSTLAFATIIESLVHLTFGVNVRSLQGAEGSQSFEFFGVYATPFQCGVVGGAVVLGSIVAWIMHGASFGRITRAIVENGPAAEASAIDVARVRRIVWAVSAMLAAVAGVIVGYETNLQPTMGSGYMMKAFAAMVCGGFGNLWGTILSCYLLGFVENFSIGLSFDGHSLPAGYKDAFAYLTILVVVLLKPSGLFSRTVRGA